MLARPWMDNPPSNRGCTKGVHMTIPVTTTALIPRHQSFAFGIGDTEGMAKAIAAAANHLRVCVDNQVTILVAHELHHLDEWCEDKGTFAEPDEGKMAGLKAKYLGVVEALNDRDCKFAVAFGRTPHPGVSKLTIEIR